MGVVEWWTLFSMAPVACTMYSMAKCLPNWRQSIANRAPLCNIAGRVLECETCEKPRIIVASGLA